MPEKTKENRGAGAGADVLVADENSTQWYSGGATHSPMTLVPSRSSARGRVKEILDGVLMGQEVGVDEIVALFGARGTEVPAVAEVADQLRRASVGDTVRWGHNRSINFPNVCTLESRVFGLSQMPLTFDELGVA